MHKNCQKSLKKCQNIKKNLIHIVRPPPLRPIHIFKMNQLMNTNQHGSRKRKSCLSQLLEHHEEILKMLENGGNVDVIYTDFEKAYEKVDQAKLLEKMKKQYGITGKIGKWLQNFFQNRYQQVLIEETKSKESKVVSGAIQGSVLGPVFFLMFIDDITKEVTSDIKLFVDDAKIKDKIESEDDVEKLQESLDKLFKWEVDNKMKFNGAKFQLLRYGPNEDIKNNTTYFTGNMEETIEQFSSLRDLGVIMTDDAKFNTHIEKVVKTVRQKIGWILRTFFTRRTDILKQLWKSLVQCHIDYCSQLYLPSQSQGLQAIERLFYDFSSKIPDIREENYWMRLSQLQMYSQQRRMERYRIIYIWKILESYAPNCGIELARENIRIGRKCKIPCLKTNTRSGIQTLRESSFQINGARLFNSLPKHVREIRSNQEDFKEALDLYLSNVPDEPRIGSLVPSATDQLTGNQSNSLLAWATNYN